MKPIQPVIDQAFPKGINNREKATRLPDGFLLDAINVDVDNSGGYTRRDGTTKKYSGSQMHSLWSSGTLSFAAEGSNLKKLTVTNGVVSATTIKSGLQLYRELSYVDINGEVYYSNGIATGKIKADATHHNWGIAAPQETYTASALTTGGMDAGRYQVTISYVTALGEESGAPRGYAVDVVASGGIQLTNIPTSSDSDVSYVAVYITEANGDVFYLYRTYANGTTGITLSKSSNKGRALKTHLLDAMPPGDILEYFSSRAYVASGRVLWYSEPLNYGLYNPSSNFILFPADITLAVAVGDGLYVAADKTYFIQIADQFTKPFEVLPYGAVKNAFAKSQDDQTVEWFSHRGIVRGANGGQVTNLTEANVTIDKYEKGSVLLRKLNGIKQFIGVAQNKLQSGFKATDYAEAEVRRAASTV